MSTERSSTQNPNKKNNNQYEAGRGCKCLARLHIPTHERKLMSNYIAAGKIIAKAQVQDRGESIPYRPAYNKITKNVAASILLQQIWYWWSKQGGDFYKYRTPCSQSKDDDSWIEELGFTEYQFDKAIKILGKKVTTGDSLTEFFDKSLVIWWTDNDRKTWYRVNEKNFFYAVGLAYKSPEILEENNLSNLLCNCDGHSYIDSSDGHNYIGNSDGRKNILTETTRDYTETKSLDSPLSAGNKSLTPAQRFANRKTSNADRQEPELVDEGDEFGDQQKVGKRPKWTLPNTGLAKQALSACNQKYYSKGDKTKWLKIEKGMVPLTSGIVSQYPTEWVMNRIKIAEEMNANERKIRPGGVGIVVSFPKLLSSINNEEKRIVWLQRNIDKITAEAGNDPNFDISTLGAGYTDDFDISTLGADGYSNVADFDEVRKLLGITE